VVLILHVDDGSVFGVIVNLNAPEKNRTREVPTGEDVSAKEGIS
jgi:hypothetical protein